MIEEMKYKVKQKRVVKNESQDNQKHILLETKKNEKRQKLKALANYRNQKYKLYCKRNKVYSQSSKSTRVRPEIVQEKDPKIDAWNVNEA